MCTAATYHTKDHYFGRTLDVDFTYDESIAIAPRNFPLRFRKVRDMEHHYAIIGVALVADGVPLYYDATNEKGLSAAGLSFPKNACYKPECYGKENVTPFELIPWLLGQCATVAEARELLARTNLVDMSFNSSLGLSPLHWIVADKESAITVEPLRSGLRVYDNPLGILSNNPPFDFQMLYLDNFINLTRDTPVNRFAANLPLEPYSNGMGAMGLPGDMSSASRFVKAAFMKMNSVCGETEEESVSQLFHILNSVAQLRGCVCVGEDKFNVTRYTSCCNMDRGYYYYTTYNNSQLSEVDLHRENLDQAGLICYPMLRKGQIQLQN